MNRDFLKDVAPLLTEMLLDGVRVEIIPRDGKAYPDMTFAREGSRALVFLDYRADVAGGDGGEFLVALCEADRNRWEVRGGLFAALGLVLEYLQMARVAGEARMNGEGV